MNRATFTLLLHLAAGSVSASLAGADTAETPCSRRHTIDKEVKTPSLNRIAVKFKRHEADAVRAIDAKSSHPKTKAAPEEVAAAVAWMVAR